MNAPTALFTSSVRMYAPSRRRRVVQRQIVADPVAGPAACVKAALDYYADEDNYQGDEDYNGVRFVPVHDERGQKARRAMAAYYELAPLLASNAANDAALQEIEEALDFYADDLCYVGDDCYPAVLADAGVLALKALGALEALVDTGARYDGDDA
ncbi:MAG: hypothetical protein ABI780_12000 [Ardenticatenales bacterium]